MRAPGYNVLVRTGVKPICSVMPGLVPNIHVFLMHSEQDVDGRDISAFTRVFDALCPATTERLRQTPREAVVGTTNRRCYPRFFAFASSISFNSFGGDIGSELGL